MKLLRALEMARTILTEYEEPNEEVFSADFALNGAAWFTLKHFGKDSFADLRTSILISEQTTVEQLDGMIAVLRKP